MSVENKYYHSEADRYNPNLYIPVEDDIKSAKTENNWLNINFEPYSHVIYNKKSFRNNEYQLDDMVIKGTRVSNAKTFAERMEIWRVQSMNNLAKLEAKMMGYVEGTNEYKLAVINAFNKWDYAYHTKRYKYESAGRGVLEAVSDNMTLDLSAHARDAVGIKQPNNDYYYGGRIAGDLLTLVGGAGTAVTGAVETVGVTVGGATAVAVPVTGAQTAAGAAVAAKSTQGLGNDIVLFAKKNSEVKAFNPQKDPMDIEPIREFVSEEQFKKMEKGEPFAKHSVKERKKGDSSGSLPSEAEPNSSIDLLQDGEIKQRRYYGPDGRPIVDLDYFHSGDKHIFPHKHIWRDDLKPTRRSKH